MIKSKPLSLQPQWKTPVPLLQRWCWVLLSSSPENCCTCLNPTFPLATFSYLASILNGVRQGQHDALSGGAESVYVHAGDQQRLVAALYADPFLVMERGAKIFKVQSKARTWKPYLSTV